MSPASSGKFLKGLNELLSLVGVGYSGLRCGSDGSVSENPHDLSNAQCWSRWHPEVNGAPDLRVHRISVLASLCY
jgi:hypothetical protein